MSDFTKVRSEGKIMNQGQLLSKMFLVDSHYRIKVKSHQLVFNVPQLVILEAFQQFTS